MPQSTQTEIDTALSSADPIKSLGESVGKMIYQYDQQSKAVDAVEGRQKKTDEGLDKAVDKLTKLMQAQQDVELSTKEFEKREKEFKERIDGLERTLLEVRTSNKEGDQGNAEKYKNCIAQYLRNGQKMDDGVKNDYYKAFIKATTFGCTKEQDADNIKTFIAGNNPRGGYWFMPEKSDVITKQDFEISPMTELATTVNVVDSITFPIDDELLLVRDGIGELDVSTESETTQIGEIQINVYPVDAKPKATRRMIDVLTFDIQSYLMGKFDEAYAIKSNANYVIGNGAQRARGFLTLPEWTTPEVYERFKLEQILSGSDGAVTVDGFIDTQAALHEVFQPNAVWTMKRKTFGEVLKLDNNGEKSLLNFNFLKVGAPKEILGRPVRFMNDMPTVANDALSVAYGDFKKTYTIAQRPGILVIVDEVTETPQVLYYMAKYSGGDVTRFDSLKIMKLKANP